MKAYRLNRLFNPLSGRCFDVAVDHGFFNQPGFLQGIGASALCGQANSLGELLTHEGQHL